ADVVDLEAEELGEAPFDAEIPADLLLVLHGVGDRSDRHLRIAHRRDVARAAVDLDVSVLGARARRQAETDPDAHRDYDRVLVHALPYPFLIARLRATRSKGSYCRSRPRGGGRRSAPLELADQSRKVEPGLRASGIERDRAPELLERLAVPA